MSVAVDRVARKYLNVVAGNAINVDIPCFSEDHVVVLYGRVGNAAVLDTDYTVTLDVAGGYDDFVVTPTASLITKINALITADPDEANQIVVRRVLDVLTDITPETAYFRKTLATEFDKTAMRFQQLVEADSRAIRVSETDTGVTGLVLPDTPARGNAGAGSCLEFDADGNVVLGPRTSTVLAQVEAARDAAVAAQVAAEAAENNAELAEANAESAQAASEAARDTSQAARDASVAARDLAQGYADAAAAAANAVVAGKLSRDGSDAMTAPLRLTTVATPAAPAAGEVKVYAKADGKLYRQDHTSGEKSIGGGPSLGTDSIIRTNAQTISENITFPATTNGMSAGPITIATGYTVEIPTGSYWSVV